MTETPEERAIRSIYQRSSMTPWEFSESNVPEVEPTIQSVRLTRGQLACFRERYTTLMEFAAFMCGTSAEKLCMDDLMRMMHSIRQGGSMYPNSTFAAHLSEVRGRVAKARPVVDAAVACAEAVEEEIKTLADGDTPGFKAGLPDRIQKLTDLRNAVKTYKERDT